MQKLNPYIKLLSASLLFVLSLTVAFWEHKATPPPADWSKPVIWRQPLGPGCGRQFMVYAERPIMRKDQACDIYLRVRNTGERPFDFGSTYLTNHSYINGRLYGETIGNWEPRGGPITISPGKFVDIPCARVITHHPDRIPVWSYGFDFNGIGFQTNTVTVYMLPSRPFWLALAALAALLTWRAWLGVKRCQKQEGQTE